METVSYPISTLASVALAKLTTYIFAMTHSTHGSRAICGTQMYNFFCISHISMVQHYLDGYMGFPNASCAAQQTFKSCIDVGTLTSIEYGPVFVQNILTNTK